MNSKCRMPHNPPSIHRFEKVDLKELDKRDSKEIEKLIRSDYLMLINLFNRIAVDGIKTKGGVKRLSEGTKEHSKRVAELASMTMEIILNPSLRSSSQEAEFEGVLDLDYNSRLFYKFAAEIGGLFHDIGKIYFPKELTEFKINITVKDRMIINMHPENGLQAFLDKLKSNLFMKHMRNIFILPIMDAILHHHERYDGRPYDFDRDMGSWDHGGYPDNLKGEEISIISRIVCVSDTFDAMTGLRIYRMPDCNLSPFKAIREIEQFSGARYDPKIVSVFKQVISNRENLFASISNDYDAL